MKLEIGGCGGCLGCLGLVGLVVLVIVNQPTERPHNDLPRQIAAVKAIGALSRETDKTRRGQMADDWIKQYGDLAETLDLGIIMAISEQTDQAKQRELSSYWIGRHPDLAEHLND